MEEPGRLPTVSVYANKRYLTTTALLHFKYQDVENQHLLEEITIACVPSGLLQDHYNPTAEDTIWLAGRNAPTLEEDFRVRLSFDKLSQKAAWRIQRISYNPQSGQCGGTWRD